MEGLQMFAEMLMSSSTESLARCRTFSHSYTYSSTVTQFTLVDMKQAWASSKLFADRPLVKTSSARLHQALASFKYTFIQGVAKKLTFKF